MECYIVFQSYSNLDTVTNNYEHGIMAVFQIRTEFKNVTALYLNWRLLFPASTVCKPIYEVKQFRGKHSLHLQIRTCPFERIHNHPNKCFRFPTKQDCMYQLFLVLFMHIQYSTFCIYTELIQLTLMYY